MGTRVVVDASVWVSLYTNEDINYDRSRLWMGRYIANNGSFVAPSIVFIEVAAAISRRTSDSALAKQAVKSLEQSRTLSTLEIIAMKASLVLTAVTLAADLRLRAGDAIYVALAHQLNIPLVTWDKEQLQRAGKLITTYAPDTYPFDAGKSTSEE